MHSLIARVLRRYSTGPIARTVIVSESNDIHTNLALEDWFYRNGSFEREQLLMLWSNDPCVVIGKFQNPWLEANVSRLDVITPDGVKLARRNSGGGAVYHDRGNLNLTFFTSRDSYKRRTNLEVIRGAMLRDYDLKIEIAQREDLVLGDCKVSGTASKLGRFTAYHHCTLLVNVDKGKLTESLRKPDYEIETNATRSTRSEIANLKDFKPSMTVEDLTVSIGREYLSPMARPPQNDLTKFRILRPSEDDFPGLTETRDGLLDWNWNYGRCPKFTARKHRPVPVDIVVEDGFVARVSAGRNANVNAALTDEFSRRKFGGHLFDEVQAYLGLLVGESGRRVT